MTAHLSISYTASTPAATSAAGAGAVASADTAGSAGFLAALIDQLLAGGAATTPAAADATAPAPVPFGTPIDPATLAAPSATPQGLPLLTTLTKTVEDIKAELDAGDKPTPDQLKKLGDLADALAALIAGPVVAPAVAATPPLAPAAAPDPLAVAAIPSAGTTQNSPTPSLPAPALPAIAQLSADFATVSTTVAPVSPEVAQKLTALAQKLDAAQASPEALAQITGTADTDGTALDQIVRQLIGDTPPATGPSAPPSSPTAPQLATPQLPLPATVAETPAPKAPDPAPASSATSTTAPATVTVAKLSGDGKPGDKPASDDQQKSDAKLIAAATAGDAKADRPDPTASTAAATAAPSTTATAVARPQIAAYTSAPAAINMGQLAFEMVRQVQQGTSRFTIRLDPPELGRVDVRMHVDATGALNARLTVDRSETLDMFQRDRGSLEKALTQAGLDGGKASLEFSLRQNPFAGLAGGDQRQGGANPGARFTPSANAGDDDTAVPAITLYRGTASAGGVNLFV